MYIYNTRGTCSSKIQFEIIDNKVFSVSFEGGCDGNLQAISALAEGMEAQDLINKLKGIDCGFRGTSCPDQLAKALEEAEKNK